jgi:hypothetical protein
MKFRCNEAHTVWPVGKSFAHTTYCERNRSPAIILLFI